MRLGLISCCCSMVGFVGGLILLLAGFFMYTQFESIFGSTVKSQMYIDDQVYWWYDLWLQPPARESLTVHIFAVENAADWRKNPARTRPQLRVVGPFVFRVHRTKERVNFTGSDHRQIGYDERVVYEFDELLSYESLDESATVANAELMILNPFIMSMVRRASSVARISSSLNSSINQMLGLYEANLFIERPVRRVIFGPSSDDAQPSALPQPIATMPPAEGSGSWTSLEGSGELSNETISLMRLQQDGVAVPVGPGVYNGIRDDATLEILKIYDKVQQYLNKLGVDVSPYDLLNAQLRKPESKMAKLREPDGSPDLPYQFNSMMGFFQNNSLQKFSLYTGKESNRNGELIRWNNEKYKLRT